MNAKKLPVTDNKQKERYEMPVDHYICFIEYIRPEKGIVCLTHTEIPRAIQNQGYGTMLVEGVLQMIRQEGDRVVPLCGFVAGYIEKHPHWMSLVAEGIKEV